MPAEAITELADVQLPAMVEEQWNQVSSEVQQDGDVDLLLALLRDIVDAIEQGKPNNDHRPLAHVIESWYGTLQIRRQVGSAGFAELVKRLRQTRPTGGLTDEQVKARLKIA